MLRKILLVLLVLIAVFLAYAATRPDTFRIERSQVINSPAERIFPLINDLDNWGQWSPWEQKDPDMKRQRSGAEAGPGSIYAWQGNSQVGTGVMQITSSTPPRDVVIDLDFQEPMAARNQVVFTLVPEGAGTKVTWTMTGRNSYPAKIMHTLMDMDAMVGSEFASGLADLKAAAERPTR